MLTDLTPNPIHRISLSYIEPTIFQAKRDKDMGTNQELKQPNSKIALAMLLGLSMLMLFGNILISVGCDVGDELTLVAWGFVCAQICAFGIWTVLGFHRLLNRILFLVGLGGTFTIAYCWGALYAAFSNENVHRSDVSSAVMAITGPLALLFLGVATPLVVLRFFSFQLVPLTGSSHFARSGFSIAEGLAFVALVAFCLCLAGWWLDPISSADKWPVVITLVINGAIASLVFAIPTLLLLRRRTWIGVCAVGVTAVVVCVFGIPFLNCLAFVSIASADLFWRGFALQSCFVAGGMSALIGFAGTLKFAEIRLKKGKEDSF